MNKPRGIDPTQAREKVRAGQATLVCAYDRDDRCRDIMLEDSVMLSRWPAARTEKDREIIFYCEDEGEETSRKRVEEYQRLGYRNSRYLVGGVEAWKKSGYPLAAEVEPQNPAHA
jgi:rhodanese-related sulfurtransferase